MKRRKPDVMALLAILVAFGVLVSVWTQTALSDAQAATRIEAAQQQAKAHYRGGLEQRIDQRAKP